ncbi:MAG: hypothetical protein EU547_03335 [Promethearchaeota archaeon]|nr:MAG: hypothetical protein EU547_03335 [Candidatus Lokiarchaeota archaeon]
MIYQGLFNILNLYLKEASLLYISLNDYFKECLGALDQRVDKTEEKRENVKKMMREMLDALESDLEELGFNEVDFLTTIYDPFIKIKDSQIDKIRLKEDIYDIIITPLIHELVFEKVCEYLCQIGIGQQIIINLRQKDAFPLETLIEIRQLKDLYDKNTDKVENLRDYIEIEHQIIESYKNNKEKIESLEELTETRNKIQLIYLIYRIINYFNLETLFDFSYIKKYLTENIDEWLRTIPLVTLKNPELYFCGIYLSHHLDISIDKEKVKDFLSELYLEFIDGFDSPIMESSCALYYYVKSLNLLDIELEQDKVDELIKADITYFGPNKLKELETNCLVVILKISKILGVFDQLEPEKIKKIDYEIQKRIGKNEIKQYRDGFFSSEATYYVLFYYYMRNNFEDLRAEDLLEKIVSRIYRNLEILDFSKDTSYDLMSELFYSCESLKLLNCIEERPFLLRLANYLFPQSIVDELKSKDKLTLDRENFRHLGVSRTTGETLY